MKLYGENGCGFAAVLGDRMCGKMGQPKNIYNYL